MGFITILIEGMILLMTRSGIGMQMPEVIL
jgi:hypothetical protein